MVEILISIHYGLAIILDLIALISVMYKKNSLVLDEPI